jgi:hypothetical protein
MIREIFFAIMIVIAIKGCMIINHEYPYVEFFDWDWGDSRYDY